jgi:hypothetical protein
MGDKIGYQFTFLFFAIMGSVLAFAPVLVLMFKGEKIRERFGTPKDTNALDHRTEDNLAEEPK